MADDPTDRVWHLTGADRRLTIHQRPQGCTDLVLDGQRVLSYLTGVGGNAADLFSAAGLTYRRLGDPDAPPHPPDLVAVLAELVNAIDAAGIVAPRKRQAGPRSDVKVVGQIAPPTNRRLAAALNRARRTIHQPPV